MRELLYSLTLLLLSSCSGIFSFGTQSNPQNRNSILELSNNNISFDSSINTINYNRFSNYQETTNCVDGIVVYEGQNDYYIIEVPNGFTICSRYVGNLSEGDRVRGELNSYNFKYIVNKRTEDEVKIYIENYMLSEDAAVKWMGKHKHLKSKDQEAFSE